MGYSHLWDKGFETLNTLECTTSIDNRLGTMNHSGQAIAKLDAALKIWWITIDNLNFHM